MPRCRRERPIIISWDGQSQYVSCAAEAVDCARYWYEPVSSISCICRSPLRYDRHLDHRCSVEYRHEPRDTNDSDNGMSDYFCHAVVVQLGEIIRFIRCLLTVRSCRRNADNISHPSFHSTLFPLSHLVSVMGNAVRRTGMDRWLSYSGMPKHIPCLHVQQKRLFLCTLHLQGIVFICRPTWQTAHLALCGLYQALFLDGLPLILHGQFSRTARGTNMNLVYRDRLKCYCVEPVTGSAGQSHVTSSDVIHQVYLVLIITIVIL